MGDEPKRYKHGFIRDHEPWKYKHGFILEALMNCVFEIENILDKHLEDDPAMKSFLEGLEQNTDCLKVMEAGLSREVANVTNVDGCPKCLEAAGFRRED
jgi:hypothetical protein